MIDDRNDRTLLEAAASGDRDAFDVLASRYLLRLRLAALRITNDPALAEDVAQDTLLRAWTRAWTYRPDEAAVSTWLHRIAINVAIDRLRAARPLAAMPDDVTDPAPSAEIALAASQTDALLAAAIAALPVRQRAAVTLTYGEGWSGARVAQALSVSLRALEGLLHRGRRAIRAYLDEKGA